MSPETVKELVQKLVQSARDPNHCHLCRHPDEKEPNIPSFTRGRPEYVQTIGKV